jgi:hypothetical protein
MSNVTKLFAIKTGSREHRDNTRLAIRDREAFKTSGALSATEGNYGYSGRLDKAVADAYAENAGKIDYVVFSYSTPIAWHVKGDTDAVDDGQWFIPLTKYSMTTTTHQSVVKQALVGLSYTEIGER